MKARYASSRGGRIGYNPQKRIISSKDISKKDWYSTCVRETTYDPEREELRIEFTARGTYAYFGFPVYAFEELNNAGSRGKYFNLYIRDRYEYERISS